MTTADLLVRQMFNKSLNDLGELSVLTFYQQTIGATDSRQHLLDPVEFQQIIRDRACKSFFVFLFLFFNGKLEISNFIVLCF